MSNFKINFELPWLLLLLIPAIALVLYTLFKVNKRFRYTRNRVISCILGLISVTMATLLLSGMTISYDRNNDKNEVMLVVDMSLSNSESEILKDSYIKEAIDNAPKNVSLGIVTFGYNQVYALELTRRLSDAYDIYINSERPLAYATNIADALLFASSKLENKKTAKIILLTDGIETDKDAIKAIAALSIDGISVDVVDYNNSPAGGDLLLKEVKLPNDAIRIDDNTQIELIIESTDRTDAAIRCYDNDEEIYYEYVSINRGLNSIFINHSFKDRGVHELRLEASASGDSILENNTLYSFVNIEFVDKILILERENESVALNRILKDSFNVEARNIKNAPMSIEELRRYDQVILMNISNADMPVGFIDLLNSYVYEYGGGMLTVGGTKEELGKRVPNVYDREDMKDTLYQEMIPVIAEDYKPPVAVMLVIDTSGSMDNKFPGSDKSMMDEAKESAKAALRALDSRDYLGVVTFAQTATTIIPPTPVSQRDKIETAIDRISAKMDGTVYSNGLERAGIELKAISRVNKKHIILISDGEPSHGDSQYINKTRSNYNSGVTTSVVSYGKQVEQMKYIAEEGHGRSYVAASGAELEKYLKKDLGAPEIREFQQKSFKPSKGDASNILNGVNEEDIPNLDGFFGAKLKREAKAPLIGEFGEPIYASWSYGKGTVGSFMCDLNGELSSAFINSSNGALIIKNMVQSLFPMSPMEKKDIELNLIGDNICYDLNIYSSFNKGEEMLIKINKLENGNWKPINEIKLNDYSGNSTIAISFDSVGLYEIEAIKIKNGKAIANRILYKAISYSKEFNPFLNNINNDEFINKLVEEGNGNIIRTPGEAYDSLVMSFHKELDLRYTLASICIISLLLDLAVSKFKFKWPHEIINERKRRR